MGGGLRSFSRRPPGIIGNVHAKRCARCEECKSVTEFGPGKKWRDGLFPYCRPCARAAVNASKDRHRDAINAAQLAKYHSDPVARAARIAQTMARERADKERANARKAAWAKANAEKVKAAKRKWQQANLATFVRASNARRRAVKLSAPALPFDPRVILGRWEYFAGRCWICHHPADAMDHVKPLTKGGWNIPANLRPVCTPCNTRKRNRWPFAA